MASALASAGAASLAVGDFSLAVGDFSLAVGDFSAAVGDRTPSAPAWSPTGELPGDLVDEATDTAGERTTGRLRRLARGSEMSERLYSSSSLSSLARVAMSWTRFSDLNGYGVSWNEAISRTMREMSMVLRTLMMVLALSR